VFMWSPHTHTKLTFYVSHTLSHGSGTMCVWKNVCT